MRVIEKEVWKPVVGYEGLYDVSNLGRMRRSLNDSGGRAGKILSPKLSTKGYFRAELYSGSGRFKRPYIHRLVLEAFVEPCPPGHQADHKDFDRVNNCLENLQWLPVDQNARRTELSKRRWAHGLVTLEP